MARRKMRHARWVVLVSGLAAAPSAHSALGAAESVTTVEVLNRQTRGEDCAGVAGAVDTDLSVQRAATEVRVLASPASDKLLVRLPSLSSMVVRKSPSGELRVTLCKRAWAQNEEEVSGLLDEVRLVADQEELSVEGPGISRDRLWTGDLILEVPQRVALDLEAERGGITLEGTRGIIRARTLHGGIFARPEAGTLSLASDNGSIDLRIEQDRWEDGAGVEAMSRNGSLRATVPQDFSFALAAESKFGKLHLQGDRLLKATEDKTSRRFRTSGSGATLHLVTVNGPLFIRAIPSGE